MNFANQVKHNLLNIIAEMSHYPWLFAKNPETDFSRKRKLDFSSLLQLSISMEAGSVRDELYKFFSYEPDTLSNSAFFQQRNKLLPETFPFLFHQFNNQYDYTLDLCQYFGHKKLNFFMLPE